MLLEGTKNLVYAMSLYKLFFISYSNNFVLTNPNRFKKKNDK
jgi:hypothetical protein